MNVELSSGKSRAESTQDAIPDLRTKHLLPVPSSRARDNQETLVRLSEQIVYSEDRPGLRVGESNFRHLKAKDVSFGSYSTKLYLPLETRLRIETSPAILAVFHGLNATVSHAGSGLTFINDMVNKHKIYAETIDQPGCGNNTEFSVFDLLESALDYYTAYLKELKSRALDKPLIVTGFCYSSGFLVEVNKRNPGLIDGMILSGLVIPDPDLGLNYSIEVESKMYNDGLIYENPAVRVRADRIYSELLWTKDRNPFGEIPTLILIGQKDPFMTSAAKSLFHEWAANRADLVKYIEVEGGGHGVLGPIKDFPQSTQLVRENVLSLIERAKSLKKERNIIA